MALKTQPSYSLNDLMTCTDTTFVLFRLMFLLLLLLYCFIKISVFFTMLNNTLTFD